MNTGAVNIHGYVLEAGQVAHWLRAMEFARQGRMDPAIAEIVAILRKQPDFAPGMVQHAYLALAADRYREARASAQQAAFSAVPCPPGFALELIRLLRRFEEHECIADLVARTDWRSHGTPGLLVQAAGELGPIGLYSQANDLLDLAEAAAPGDPQALALRGTILLVSGEMDEARRLLNRALGASKAGGLPHVRWLLTMQPDQACIDAEVAEIEQALQRTTRGTEDEAYLAYALHNLHHAAGRFDEAWRALERGCRVKRALVAYDRDEQKRLFDALHHMKIPASPDPSRNESPRTIFIVGMHRSGTSVLERVLAGHSEVADGGESYVFPAAMREATDHFSSGIIDRTLVARAAGIDLGIAGDRFRKYARWRARGRGWFTEKLPSNFLNTGFILQAMPDACVIHMRRDPIDTCFSNLRTFFSRAAAYSYVQEELAEYYLMYARLMQHWREQFPGRILDVDYGEFVADPEFQARRVMDFCGLQYQAGALDVAKQGGYAATASTASVRRGILKDRGGVWKNYAAHLQPLLDGLQHAGS